MVDEIHGIKMGDLVDLVLEPNAKKSLEAQPAFFLPINGNCGVNIPGRKYSGHVVRVEEAGYIFLAMGWDSVNNVISSDSPTPVKFYFDAIKTYEKK